MITKQDIQAMKTCDSVVFRTRDGKDTIECSKKVNDVWEQEKKHVIEVSHICTLYGEPGRELDNAFTMIHSAQWNPVYLSIAGLLRPDDSIKLEWIGSNNNQYLDNANLYQDRLDLQIHRPMKSGHKVMTFTIDNSICANNSARMIRTVEKSIAA